MKKSLITLSLVLISFLSYSQDRIYLNDKDCIEVKIKKIKNDTVFSKISGEKTKYNKSLNDIEGVFIYNTEKFVISNMYNDTIKFTNESVIPRNKIIKARFNNNFQNYYINNGNSNNIEFEYILYSLEKYRKQSNTGKIIKLSGAGLIVIGGLTININELGNINNSSKILMGLGSLTSLTGFFVEWNSLKWLKNVTIPTNEIGIGYTYKF